MQTNNQQIKPKGLEDPEIPELITNLTGGRTQFPETESQNQKTGNPNGSLSLF